MNSRELHPGTGLHYVHIVTPYPAYADVVRTISRLAERTSWMTFDPRADLQSVRNSDAYRNPNLMFLVWGGHDQGDPGPRDARKCRVAIHYLETIGELEKLLPNQRAVFGPFLSWARNYDVVFAQTPAAVSWFEGVSGVVSRLAPFGYDPAVLGRPDFKAGKAYDLAFYGARLGRRDLLPSFIPHLRHSLHNTSGAAGMERQRRLNRARAIFQLHHSSADCSFAAFRLWHAVATSAALLMEPIDAWPAIAGRHYLEFPTLDEGNLEDAARTVDQIFDAVDLADFARRAHEDLSVYTPEYCMERFVVTALMKA